MNFSVEMETGTGKTYVYIRTLYELNRQFGFKKFVIVVPGVAIREGVLKNLQITYDHFQGLYDKIPFNFQVYDSKRVSNLRSFATNNNIEVLVMNIDSFAKDENIINRPNDKLTGQHPENQQGARLYDRNINRLTVVANEAYEDFVKTLQIEITRQKTQA